MIAARFERLLNRFELKREGLGFYTLRHIHRTIADGARDSVACDIIMGHTDGSMGATYRERVEDARLVAVANHVREWLMAGREVQS
jgi:integrase